MAPVGEVHVHVDGRASKGLGEVAHILDRALEAAEVRIGGVVSLLWLLLGLLLFPVGGMFFFIYMLSSGPSWSKAASPSCAT